MEADSVFNILQHFFVGCTLRIAALQRRAVCEVSVTVLLDHYWKYESFQPNLPLPRAMTFLSCLCQTGFLLFLRNFYRLWGETLPMSHLAIWPAPA